jgi:hypothetical protein
MPGPHLGTVMGTTATDQPDAAAGLSGKQQRILRYLREHVGERTYFKSRLIAEDLSLSAKEVGANMGAIREGDFDVCVEQWGYSSGTTWEVTRAPAASAEITSG